MLGPGLDAAAGVGGVFGGVGVGGVALDVFLADAVVEVPRGDVGEVAEAVPLGAALGVAGVGVVVGDARPEGLDAVDERFAAEARGGGDGEGEVEGHDFAGVDLAGCGGFGARRGEEVEAAEFVVGAPEPGGFGGGVGRGWGEGGAEGEGGCIGVPGGGDGRGLWFGAHDCGCDVGEAGGR